MQLVSQVNLSAVITVENTKIKLCGELCGSQFSPSSCEQAAGKLLLGLLSLPQLGDVVSCGNWQSKGEFEPKTPRLEEGG